MATQKVKPGPDVWGRGERQQQRRQTYRKVGTVALITIVVVVVAASAFALRTSSRTTDAATPARPSATGPAVTSPAELWGAEPRADFVWLPPKGAEPSTPVRGQVVMRDGGIHPWWAIQVYADGRVIWLRQIGLTGSSESAPTTGWLERRLTPKGIELLRSAGAPPPVYVRIAVALSSLPASAWEDPEAKPYVPSRYVVCATWSRETLRLFPQRTQDLLRSYTDEKAVVRGEVNFRGVACPAVTIEEARALDEVFLEVGFERSATAGGLVYDVKVADPDVSSIGVIPLLPNGTFMECCPG